MNELQTTFEQWQRRKDPDSLRQVLHGLQPTVDAAIKSYGGNDQALRTRAFIMAREALDTYDPSRKAAINTHVMTQLQRLHRVSAERNNVVHVPENVRMDSLQIRNYRRDYQDRNGVEPSDIQVADALHMNLQRVAKSGSQGSERSDTAAVSEKGDVMTQSAKSPEDIWKDFVYHDLDETNRKVFEWTTGYQGRPVMKKQEVAAKLGISPAAVSQRIGTITKYLGQINDVQEPVTETP